MPDEIIGDVEDHTWRVPLDINTSNNYSRIPTPIVQIEPDPLTDPPRYKVGTFLLLRSTEQHDLGDLDTHIVQMANSSFMIANSSLMRNSHGYLTVRYVTHDQSSYNIAASRTSSNSENMGRDLDDSSLYHVLDEVPIECITPISFIAAKRLGVVCVDDNDSHMAKLFINETQSRNQESIPGKEITIARDSDGCDYYNVQLSSLLVLLNEAYIYSDALTIDNILSDYPMGVCCALCSSVINPMDEVNAVPVWFKDRARVEHICFTCAATSGRITSCSQCSKNVYGTRGEEGALCYHCGRTHASCSSCGRIVRRSRMYADADEIGLICSDCSQEAQPIRRYNWRPLKPKFHGNGPLFFGIEVEVERLPGTGTREAQAALFVQNLKATQYADLYYIKHDGSLENGWEVVSSPFSMAYLRQNRAMLAPISALKTSMIADGVSTCGLHVHMSSKAFSTLHLYRFLKVVYRNKSFVSAIAGRESDQYASFSLPGTSIGRKSRRLLDDENHDRKYTAVNTTNKDTIEMRVFSGTLDVERITGCIEFCHALWAFTRVASVKHCTRARFLDYICHRKKSYIRLIKIISDAGFKTEGRK